MKLFSRRHIYQAGEAVEVIVLIKNEGKPLQHEGLVLTITGEESSSCWISSRSSRVKQSIHETFFNQEIMLTQNALKSGQNVFDASFTIPEHWPSTTYCYHKFDAFGKISYNIKVDLLLSKEEKLSVSFIPTIFTTELAQTIRSLDYGEVKYEITMGHDIVNDLAFEGLEVPVIIKWTGDVKKVVPVVGLRRELNMYIRNEDDTFENCKFELPDVVIPIENPDKGSCSFMQSPPKEAWECLACPTSRSHRFILFHSLHFTIGSEKIELPFSVMNSYYQQPECFVPEELLWTRGN